VILKHVLLDRSFSLIFYQQPNLNKPHFVIEIYAWILNLLISKIYSRKVVKNAIKAFEHNSLQFLSMKIMANLLFIYD